MVLSSTPIGYCWFHLSQLLEAFGLLLASFSQQATTLDHQRAYLSEF